ncbi:MAG: lipopolysaccharide heptosyltransferase II [Planctomycetota bacterium]|jgi:heptosyltransferase-2
MDAGRTRVAALTPNWLGDVVMSLPALRALARELVRRDPPEALDIWTPRAFAPLVGALVPEAEVVPFDLGRGWFTRLRGRMRLARAMRAQEYRAAVMFPNSFGSALAAWRACVPERIGTPLHSRGLLLTKKVEPQGPAEHLAEAYVRLAEAAAGMRLKAADPDASIELPEAVRARARALLEDAGLDVGSGTHAARFVAMAPGAAYGPAKQWGEANFASVARHVAKGTGAATVVVGTRADSGAAAEIARLAGGQEGARVVDLTGRTGLVELAGVISLASGFVGNDSGAAHLAAALGVPTVAVYLSTDPVRTGQRGPRVRLVAADLECRPCMRRWCPGGHYRCRDAVAPELVAERLADASV